jgi:hypothetical protein
LGFLKIASRLSRSAYKQREVMMRKVRPSLPGSFLPGVLGGGRCLLSAEKVSIWHDEYQQYKNQ